MKNRRLNKNGKILMTILTFMLSMAVYTLLAKLGEFATEGQVYQMILILGWAWFFVGQSTTYYFIWGE